MTNDLFEEMADEFFQTCCPANDFRPGDAPPGAEPIGEFRIVNSREQVIAVLPFYQDPEDDRKAIFVWTEALRTEPSPTAKLEVWWRGDCILWSTVATQGGHPGADVLMCEHPREGEPLWISQMTIAVKGDLFRLGGMAVTLI